MPSNYAIGSLGYPSLGATDYQALAAIMNTPNPNSQVAFRGNTQTTQTTAQPQVQYVQQTKEKNSKAPIVLTVIGLLGASAVICAACKGEGTGLARIKDGFGKMLDGVKGAVSKSTSKVAETAEEAVTSGKRTITMQGTGKAAKPVVTIPGKENKIFGKKMSEQLADIGETVNAGDLASRLGKDGTLKAGNSLESIVMEGTSGTGFAKKTYTIIGAKGGEKITILENGVKVARGKGLEKGISESVYEDLVEQAKNVFSGKTKLNDSELKLHQAIIKNTNNETGLVSRIKIGGLVKDKSGKMVADKTKAGTGTFLSAVSDKFGINHKEVNALRLHDKEFDARITAFQKKGGEGLDAVKKFYEAKADDGKFYKFTLDSEGNVISIKSKDGKVVIDSTKNQVDFDDFHYKNQKLFEDLKKLDRKKWQNPVYEI